jgi:hypothetical protein
MSTVCKLDPLVRQRRTARANLLRHPPMARTATAIAILAELSLIRANPRLPGAIKHELFTRGAEQLAKEIAP